MRRQINRDRERREIPLRSSRRRWLRLAWYFRRFGRDLMSFVAPPPEWWRDPDELAAERQAEREKEPRGFEVIVVARINPCCEQHGLS